MTEILLTHSYHLANDVKQLKKMQPYPPPTVLRAAGMPVAIFDSTFKEPISGFTKVSEKARFLFMVGDAFRSPSIKNSGSASW